MSATDTTTTVDDAVEQQLDGYEPSGTTAAEWSTVRDVVAEALALLGDPDAVRRARHAVTRLAAHALRQGHRPTLRLLANDDLIDHWAASLGNDASAGTHRSRLRQVADLIDPSRASSRVTFTGSDPATDHYDAATVQRMLDHARTLSTTTRRLRAQALVLAGAGAGLDGRDLIDLPATNVRRDGDHHVIDVLGSRVARTVTVMGPYGPLLLDVARAQQERDPGCVLLGGRGSRNTTGVAVVLFDDWGGPPVTARTLRATFLASHLVSGTPLHVLCRQAGLQSVTRQVSALAVGLADELDDDQMARIAGRATPC